MNPNTIKFWLLRGELEKLEGVVLEGKGSRLLGENSPDLRTRVFLKSLPNYLTKITQIHDAVVRGSLPEVQRLINEEPKKKLALAKDSAGTPLLHKAVCYDQLPIIQWLIENYPTTTQQKDKEGRTALHYCSACKEPEVVWDVLVEGNCDISVCDKKGYSASYYLENPSELEFPDVMKNIAKKSTSGKKENMDVKASNIRIWIHNRDIGKLQQVLWDGHGLKLRRETSNNPRVKKFLEAVPFIMGTIKDVHTAAVANDLDTFRKVIAEPVSPIILCSKDSNGLTVLHKSVGLGFNEMTREILNVYPAAMYIQDNEGRTPLHYAAAVKDGGNMYNLLIESGADENKLDNKMRAPAFYKNRSSDIDMSLLTVIPEAPRVSSTKYPKNWDWRILESDYSTVPKVKKAAAKVEHPLGNEEPQPPKPNPPPNKPPPSKPQTNFNKPPPVKIDSNILKETLMNHSKSVDDEFGENLNLEIINDEEQHKENGVEENGVDENVVNENAAEPVETPVTATNGNHPATEENNNKENDMTNNDDVEILKLEEPHSNGITDEENNFSNLDPSDTINNLANEEEQVSKGKRELPKSDSSDGGMDNDREVEELVKNGNMEQLASLVLNGEGRRLLGRHSSNSELQAFIDNVPAYMGKIHAVHLAAREGNLRDLQSALDRRKFAIAKDSISPHGATPLHIAVIFGNTAVIRYLAGRFPETTHATDIDGRTPLHYAATLADNGHYYNLLLHLGANPLVQDNFGHKAEYYKQNQNDLSHKKLLRDFGAKENLADEMLTDKENTQMDIPMFHEEEGHYLASSLGDPLIKGLTEVAQTRPKDPVTYLATYLYNFANKKKSEVSNEGSDVFIISESDDSFETDDRNPENMEFEEMESHFNNPNRDDHGQSIIHFAAVRSHSRDSLYHMLQEAQINIALRDELYRTPRDIAYEANMQENIEEIDRFVVSLAARGETEKLVELLLEGYDHILDATDTGTSIMEVAKQHEHEDTIQFLQSIPHFIERREQLHNAIKSNDARLVKQIFDQCGSGAKLLAVGKNEKGRCSLHIAVLQENEEIVRMIAKAFPETMRIGDNLQRTSLHYAMGVPAVENISSILIKAGAKRIQRDLKSRQPSYYFMNKMEIESLQKENT